MTDPAPFLFSTQIVYLRPSGQKGTASHPVRAWTEEQAIEILKKRISKNPQRRIVKIESAKAIKFYDDSAWMKKKGLLK